MQVHLPLRSDLHRVSLKPEALHRPDTAWPAVLLASISITLWITVACVGTARDWAPLFTVPASTLAVYMAFTPFHEASHASVSREHRWLNQVVGWICGVPFLVVPFPVFRWIHLQHHKHTNDHEHDPDHSEQQNPLLFVAEILPSYIRHVAKNAGSFPRMTSASSVAQLCIVAVTCATGTWCGLGFQLLQYAFVPAVLGIALTGFVFDYVPHHPHKVMRREDLYGCTGVVDGMFAQGSGFSTWWLTLLLCGQNYHAIHHLYPSVPFYAYRKIWRDHQQAFLQAGVPLLCLWK